jgi:hypothetical protein
VEFDLFPSQKVYPRSLNSSSLQFTVLAGNRNRTSVRVHDWLLNQVQTNEEQVIELSRVL